MIQRNVLPNGIRVVTENITYVQSVALGIWIGVGARDESDEMRGISHCIEHMLFKGTERRTAQQIADEIDSVGGDINAFTSKEHTCYHVRVLSEYLPLAVDILGDMILSSTIDPDELAREQNVILEEIKRRDDEPEDLVHDLFGETLWPTHVLGKSVIGTPETVSAMRRGDLIGYMERRYTPDTIVVAAAGNLNHEEIVALIEKQFGHLTGSKSDWRTPEIAPVFDPGYLYCKKPVEQVNIVMGVGAYSQRSDDRYKLSILDTVLGGSMSSRLFQEIREKRGLAYSVGSYTQLYSEGGYFALYTGTGAETADQVVELMRQECRRVLSENISADELQRAKNQFRGALVMSQESMNSRMMRMGRNELVFDMVILIDEVMAKVNGVTLDDIADCARDLFERDTYAMTIVGPGEKKKSRRKAAAA